MVKHLDLMFYREGGKKGKAVLCGIFKISFAAVQLKLTD